MKLLTKFLISAAEPRQFPAPSVPEIAFLGRSNVGKSSLINSLLGEKVAKTSSSPGRTRTINFFAVRRQGQPRPEVIFADLPGYGYAKLPKEVTAEWPKFIEPYLMGRPTLALCVCLVDVNVPPQQRDQQLIAFLRHHGRPFLIVGTKSDRVSNNQLRNAIQNLQREFEVDRILPYSTKTGAGQDELWKEIRAAAQRLTAEGTQAAV
ncbi:MAG: ribosome biogenesis GTP-binding protein YihA/YsxC [Terriglobales bacterium]